MVALVYPSILPCPTSTSVQRLERRALSGDDMRGPRDSRPVSVDKTSTQPLEFIFRSQALLQAWLDWYETTLDNGSAWFAASWPQPEGGVGVRRFLGAPSYPEYIPPKKMWRVIATCQIRGRGMLPDDGAVTGLFYADFRDGTPADRIAPAATYIVTGSGAVFGGGLFRSTSAGDVDSFGCVTYASSKFGPLGTTEAFAIECDVAWSVLPNSSFSRIFKITASPLSFPLNFELGFNGGINAGHVRYSSAGTGPVDLPVTLAAGAPRTHCAVQFDGAGGMQIYVGGARVYDGSAPTFTGTPVELALGRDSYQGGCDFSVDNFRVREGVIYSGATITPPHYRN